VRTNLLFISTPAGALQSWSKYQPHHE
jgi:hypothetical protein